MHKASIIISMVSFNSAMAAALPSVQHSTTLVEEVSPLQQQKDFQEKHEPLIDMIINLGETLNSLMQSYMNSILVKQEYVQRPNKTRELLCEIESRNRLEKYLAKTIYNTTEQLKRTKSTLQQLLTDIPKLPKNFNKPPVDASGLNRRTRRTLEQQSKVHATTPEKYDQNCAFKGMRDRVLNTVRVVDAKLVEHDEMLRRTNGGKIESYYCFLVNAGAPLSELANAALAIYTKAPQTDEAERTKWREIYRKHLEDAYTNPVTDPVADAKEAFELQKKGDIAANFEAEQTAREEIEKQERQTYLRLLKAAQSAVASDGSNSDEGAMPAPAVASAVEHTIYDFSNYEATLDKGMLKQLQSYIDSAYEDLRFGRTPADYRPGTFSTNIDGTKYDVHHCELKKPFRIYFAIIPATGDTPSQYVVLSISNHETKFKGRQFNIDKVKPVFFGAE